MMFAPSEDQQPLAYLRGYPLYVTHVLVLIFTATMLVCTILGAQTTNALIAAGGFDSALVHRGQIWRILTYGLINLPSIGFVIDMVLLVWFGREVERFFGRRVFLKFYGALYLITPLIMTVLGFLRPFEIVGQTGGLAIFIAFATLYPGAMMIFNIPAMWWALGVVIIQGLILIFGRDFVGLTAFLLPVGFAHFFVRYEQGQLSLPQVNMPSLRKRPKLRVLPDPDPSSAVERDEPMAEVDALLDKIAKSGLASLTDKERARLEKAREDLMKREFPKR